MRIATGLSKLATQAERQQMPVKTFLEEIQILQAFAQELRDKICDASLYVQSEEATKSDSVVAVPNSSEPDRSSSSDNPDQELFPQFVDVLDQLTTISALVSKEISKPTYQGYRPGVAWDGWICDLTLIVNEYGLPSEVRKDVDKKDPLTVSPFVQFVAELQLHLPEEFHKFGHSNDGLSQAIYRARKGLDLSRNFFDTLHGSLEGMQWGDEVKRLYGDMPG